MQKTLKKKNLRINEFSKVAGYKINAQKINSISIYWYSGQSAKEIKKTMTFTIASKRIKYLGINLTKEDLYTDNYKTFWKKADTDKEKNRQHSWTGRLSIVKMLISSKALYRFNVITVKIPIHCFAEIENLP